MHLHRKLEEIVQTLTLGLGLGDIVSPDITMASGQILSHCKGNKELWFTHIPCLLTSTA